MFFRCVIDLTHALLTLHHVLLLPPLSHRPVIVCLSFPCRLRIFSKLWCLILVWLMECLSLHLSTTVRWAARGPSSLPDVFLLRLLFDSSSVFPRMLWDRHRRRKAMFASSVAVYKVSMKSLIHVSGLNADDSSELVNLKKYSKCFICINLTQ